MIVLQSSAIAQNASYRPCHSPSPGGSNERSECRFVCCSDVGRGEGELNPRGRQSALIKVGRCRQARCSRAVLKSFSMANTSKLRNESIFQSWMFKQVPFKVSQDHSRLLKATQAYSRGFGKKIVYFPFTWFHLVQPIPAYSGPPSPPPLQQDAEPFYLFCPKLCAAPRVACASVAKTTQINLLSFFKTF
jgi:hypothetical protein